MFKLKIPELNTRQAITIALLIGLLLGLLYTGAYIYEQHRLTIEHRDSIEKWCITTAGDTGYRYFFSEGSTGTQERINNCIKYFGK